MDIFREKLYPAIINTYISKHNFELEVIRINGQVFRILLLDKNLE